MSSSSNAGDNVSDVTAGLMTSEGRDRLRQPGLELKFDHLHLNIKGKEILSDVSGCAKPGQVFAVMGPSGSGKTTLLNIIGGRIHANSGKATIGEQPLTKKTRRKISYVLQEDIFFQNLTLEQTLMFSAELRLPESWSRKVKEEIVHEIVDELEMKGCMKTIIGDSMNRGLSGGEKKRANIANELLTDPAVLLLDEPTSGLDSATAYGLAKTLKHYAVKTKKTVLMTVHQPSAQMFFSFDNILLLSQGEIAYYGSPEDVLKYFSDIGHNCDVVHYNPADFILDMAKLEGSELSNVISECNRQRSSNPDCPILQSTLTGKKSKTRYVESVLNHESEVNTNERQSKKGSKAQLLIETSDNVYENTSNGKLPHAKIDEEYIVGKAVRSDSAAEVGSLDSDEQMPKQRQWSTSFGKQLRVLTERSFIQGKSRYFSKLKFIKCFGVAIICGLVWWQIGAGHPEERTINDITGMLFFATLYCSFDPLFDVLQIFPSERTVINKERMAGSYRLSAYYLAKLASELPLTLMLPGMFFTISYWMSGLNGLNTPWTFFAALAIILSQALASQSLGLFVSAATMDFDHALVMAVLMMVTFLLLGGFYVKNIPVWLNWLKYASPITHTWALALCTEFNSNERFLCNPELSSYPSCIPPNVTLLSTQYNVTNTTAEMTTNVTRYVAYQDILDTYHVTQEIWVSILALIAIMIVFRVLGYLCLRLFHKPVMK